MPSIENFIGNRTISDALEHMIRNGRIPHTLLLHGPEGIGKATLARRFAAALLGGKDQIEQDDLSLPQNVELLAVREKLPSEQRSENPLVFASYPDFITFPPDGPLRQISIQQIRLLRERAQLRPLKGDRRVFLIDHLDRANEQAANSLLKTLEEPPGHLILVLTAQNVYDLLPTIRSRSVQFHLTALPAAQMREFVSLRGLDQPDRRMALANGSPGLAASLDLEAYDRRREAMLSLLGAASRYTRFSDWAGYAERISAERSVKLDAYLTVLYMLLEDLLLLHEGGGEIRNTDIRGELEPIARLVSFEWLRRAIKRVDELVHFLRRNIQKSIALDAFVTELRG